MLEPVERFQLAFGLDLDAAISEVPDPAMNALTGSRRAREKAVSDALNVADNEVMPPEAHERGKIISRDAKPPGLPRLAWHQHAPVRS
jgi:hypothetical protein